MLQLWMTILMILGASLVFSSNFFLMMILINRPTKNTFAVSHLWSRWQKFVIKEEDEAWKKLLNKAGKPFGWGQAEWTFLMVGQGTVFVILTLLWGICHLDQSFPFLTLLVGSTLCYMLPYLLLIWWANYREDILSNDIARFINRYVNLLENEVPYYQAMVKAARPTKLLKQYIPSLSEYNRDRISALETFKQQLGVEEAIVLVSSMRTIEQLPFHQMSTVMQRLEWAVDSRRLFRHRKKIKSLGIGYSLIVYPSFYIGLLVAMFPWYKLLTEILDRYLV